MFPPTARLEKKIPPLLFIAASGILVYFGTLLSPFLYDDIHAIIRNPYIRNLGDFQQEVGIGNIFNRSFLLLTFAVNRHLGELDVFGYHLINILLHTFVGIALYCTTTELLRLERRENISRLENLPALVAAIHMFNPVSVEAVTYLSSRSDLLASLFYVLSFYLLARFLQRRDRGKSLAENIHLLVLMAIFLFLGFASKEIIITMPIMGIVYLRLKSGETDFKKDWLKAFWIVLPILVYLLYRTALRGNPFNIAGDPSFYTTRRIPYLFTQMGVMIFYYTLKLVFPVNLNFEPDVKLVSDFADPQSLIGAVLIVWIVWSLRRWKSPLIRLGILWALVTQLPTSSIVPLKQLATEHRIYLSGIGVSLLLGVFFLNCLNFSRQSLVVKTLVSGFLVMTTLLTVSRGLDYRTEINIWQDTAEKSPGKILVHNNLATALQDKQRYDEAERELETLLRLDAFSASAYINLGHIQFKRGRFEVARESFDTAIFLGANDAMAYHNAGLARVRLQHTDAAMPYLQKAVELAPASAPFHFSLANACKELKLYDQALQEYKASLQYEPDQPNAYNNRGVIFWELKLFPQAEAEFLKVLEIQENHAEAHNNLAGVYMLTQNYPKAILHLDRFLDLNPENANARNLRQLAEILIDPKPQ